MGVDNSVIKLVKTLLSDAGALAVAARPTLVCVTRWMEEEMPCQLVGDGEFADSTL